MRMSTEAKNQKDQSNDEDDDDDESEESCDQPSNEEKDIYSEESDAEPALKKRLKVSDDRYATRKNESNI